LEFIKYRHYHPHRKMDRPTRPEDELPKLKLIAIPGVQFFESPLDEVLKVLQQQSVAFDLTESEPSKKGIKIKLTGIHPKNIPKVTITLNSMPIGYMIKFLSETTNIHYRIEDGMVVFYPREARKIDIQAKPKEKLSQSRQVVTEKFELTKGEIFQMTDQGRPTVEWPSDFKKEYARDLENLIRYLTNFGMTFQDNSGHFFKYEPEIKDEEIYNDFWEKGTLTIRHEKRFLDKFRWFLANNPLKTECYELTQSLIKRMAVDKEKFIKPEKLGPYAKKVQEKSKRIKMPAVRFVKTPLDEVVQELQKLGFKYDLAEPDRAKKGLNLIVLKSVSDPFPEVTLSLESMTLAEMIQEVTDSVNWSYDVRSDCIRVLRHMPEIRVGPDDQGAKIMSFLEWKGIPFDETAGHNFSFDGFNMIVTHDRQTLGFINSLLDPFGDYEERYGVAVIARDGNKSLAPQWIDLGKSSLIDEQLSELRKAKGGITKPLKALHEELFVKIAPMLPTGTTDLVVSPDDSLNFLPFACLLDQDNKFLCEKYRVYNISSGRDLLFEKAEGQDYPRTFVGFGNPDFNQIEESKLAWSTKTFQNSEVLRSLSFTPLPGSQSEVRQVEKLALDESYKTFLFTGKNAAERTLRAIKSPGIIHFATHGFFISKEEVEKNPERFAFFNEEKNPDSSNPMHSSGLLLSGARQSLESYKRNISLEPENDGIFTAEEASMLDLSSTWLTVLSACDTGSGVARAGEGVLGLRRAFAMAGTQNLLLTLWPVDDTFTKDFMVSFYKEALKTGNAPKAMAKVQKDWLIRLRKEKSISQAVKLAGPFVLTFRGNPERN
jgi:CHAT domain-containing protein